MTVWDGLTLFFCLGLVLPTARMWQKQRAWKGVASAIALVGCGLMGYGSLVEPHLIEVSRHATTLAGWPAKPLKIALISDLHVGPYTSGAMLQRLVQMVNAEKADLVLIAGDFTAYGTVRERVQLHALKDLRSRLGTYAVMGNHDYYTDSLHLHQGVFNGQPQASLMEILQKANVRVLSNQSDIIEPGVALVGVDSVWAGRMDVDKAIAHLPPRTLPIALVHEPDAFGRLVKAKIPLAMAGHSHGGQIALPWVGPLVLLPDYSPEQDGPLTRTRQTGWFERDRTRMFVTRGVGASGPRARLFCRPEIAVLSVSAPAGT